MGKNAGAKAAADSSAQPKAATPPKAAAKAAPQPKPETKAVVTTPAQAQAPVTTTPSEPTASAKKKAKAKAAAPAPAPQPPAEPEPVAEEKKKNRRGGMNKKKEEDVLDATSLEARAAAAVLIDDDYVSFLHRTEKWLSPKAKDDVKASLIALKEEIEEHLRERKKGLPSGAHLVSSDQILRNMSGLSHSDLDYNAMQRDYKAATAHEVFVALKPKLIALKDRITEKLAALAPAEAAPKSVYKIERAKDDEKEKRVEYIQKRLGDILKQAVDTTNIPNKEIALPSDIMKYLFAQPYNLKSKYEKIHSCVFENPLVKTGKGAGKSKDAPVPKEIVIWGLTKQIVDKCVAGLKALDLTSVQKEVPERSFLTKFDKQKELGEEFGVDIIKPKDSKTVTILGSKANVEKAVAAVEEKLKVESSQGTLSVDIEPKKFRCACNQLSTWTSNPAFKEFKIRIVGKPDETAPPKVLLSGKSGKGMDDAKKHIELYLKKEIEIATVDGTPEVASKLKKKYGLFGQALRELRDKFQSTVTWDVQDASIILVGSQKEVREAVKLTRDLVKKASLEPTFVKIEEAKLRIFNRELLGTISTDAGCDVSKDVKNSSLAILGTGDTVEKAQALIDEVLEKQGAVVVIETTGAMVRALLQNSGSKIRSVEKDFKVTLDLNKEKKQCVILGSETDVETAQKELERFFADPEEQPAKREKPDWTKKSRKVEQDQVGGIIGKQGNTLRKIREDTGANVRISNDDAMVLIQGTKEAVRLADEMITSILEGRGKGDGKGEDKGEGKGKSEGEGEGKGKGKRDREGKGKGKATDDAPKGAGNKPPAKRSAAYKHSEDSFPTLGGGKLKQEAVANAHDEDKGEGEGEDNGEDIVKQEAVADANA